MDSDLCSNKSRGEKKDQNQHRQKCVGGASGVVAGGVAQQEGERVQSVAPARLSQVSLHFLRRHGFRRECDGLFLSRQSSHLCRCYLPLLPDHRDQLPANAGREKNGIENLSHCWVGWGKAGWQLKHETVIRFSTLCFSRYGIKVTCQKKKKLDREKRGN